MLNGEAATFQKFGNQTNLLMPSDVDGSTLPPAGSPNFFYTMKDSGAHGGSADRLEIFAFAVNWVTPANTTFTLIHTLNVTPFTYTACGFFNFNCVRQPDTTQRLDTVSEWPMFRFPYRNFGTHQSLVGTFTVGGGTGNVGAALRWFELRRTGTAWTLYQEGTFDPNDGHDRFMGSIAMDKRGNIALGYSVSSPTQFPSIRYTTRLATDPLGTMRPEQTLQEGSGSQTGNNRWGDYSALSVDPSNDCTFWYTNQYYPATTNSTWKTRIGAFTLPTCVTGTPQIELSLTVGTNASACAVSNTLVLPPGGERSLIVTV